MVLQELGSQISKALAAVQEATVVDEKVLDACLKEISTALLQADVNIKLVFNMRANVKKRVDSDTGAGLNKRKIIEKAVFDELCAMLNSGAETKDTGKKQDKDLKSGHVCWPTRKWKNHYLHEVCALLQEEGVQASDGVC